MLNKINIHVITWSRNPYYLKYIVSNTDLGNGTLKMRDLCNKVKGRGKYVVWGTLNVLIFKPCLTVQSDSLYKK